MESPAQILMNYTQSCRPDLYDAILNRIRPHSMSAVLKIFDCHIRSSVPNLQVFNKHKDTVPEFVWAFVKYLKFPTPGDAFGIQITCRVTKSDTQETLDSKHSSSSFDSSLKFNVEKDIIYELAQFSEHQHIFEFSNKRAYATVYVLYSIEELMHLLPREACHLVRGAPENKGLNINGEFRYLSTFKYILVQDRGSIKVLYQSLNHLFVLLCKLSPHKIVAFSDVRCLSQKCGIVCHFFNMIKLADRQLFPTSPDSVYRKTILFIMKYQCMYGIPLPLTRTGLAKCPNRSPLEILSFEAPKQNFSRLSTGSNTKDRWFEVKTSADKIFFGQQFNEGVGYQFALMPKDEE